MIVMKRFFLVVKGRNMNELSEHYGLIGVKVLHVVFY